MRGHLNLHEQNY